uniref:Uncharacterized protein n=1 Tax=Brassica oleracea var. oleracea TaxID=109376 RepID=A0A0D2ZSY4_BRAOL
MRIKGGKGLQEIYSMAQGVPSSVEPIGRLRRFSQFSVKPRHITSQQSDNI